MKKYIVLIIATASLAACISGKAPQDSYTSPTTGQTTIIQSDKEMCESSCNQSYNRCMDSQAASESTSTTDLHYDASPMGNLGAAGQCRSELSSCLGGCKTR